jgi:hypothetical protein
VGSGSKCETTHLAAAIHQETAHSFSNSPGYKGNERNESRCRINTDSKGLKLLSTEFFTSCEEFASAYFLNISNRGFCFKHWHKYIYKGKGKVVPVLS